MLPGCSSLACLWSEVVLTDVLSHCFKQYSFFVDAEARPIISVQRLDAVQSLLDQTSVQPTILLLLFCCCAKTGEDVVHACKKKTN
jgi:hypothetical protein